jgi:hypothetical protein
MRVATAWFTLRRRLMALQSARLLAYIWLCALGGALLLSAHNAYQRSLHVEEYAFACDPFGYLRMAREIRQAISNLEFPEFHLESTHTRLLIDLMQSQHVPLALWDEMVAPHAHHHFPRAGSVGVQYPPGTGFMLALFPEGQAVDGLNRTTIVLFLVTGILLLILAGVRQAWVSAGFVALALHLGLTILGKIGTDSFSINAALAPLLLAFVCVFAALALRAWRGNVRAAWFVALLGGLLLGFAILIRLPVVFLVPGVLITLWPQSWRPTIRDPLIAFGLGVVLSGMLPLLAHQYHLTGAWYLSTYGRDDSALPSLEPLWSNLAYYFGGGRGSRYNWALLALLIGLGGFITSRRRHKQTCLTLSWTRLIWSAVALWGLPTIYFLTHRLAISYYSVPATFGTVLLLALGGLTIECYTSPAVSRNRSSVGVSLCWVALALALLPGVATLKRALVSYARYAAPLERPARHLRLPAELSEERAWIWADLLTGTLWYYANKPAFKIGFTDAETRALAYRFVFERGEPQYIIHDSAGMQPIMDEIVRMGGILEPRGEVDRQAYFFIRWPQEGPVGTALRKGASSAEGPTGASQDEKLALSK